MSQTQSFTRDALLAGPRDDLKVFKVLTAPMALPMLERRLAQAGHRINAARLRVLLAELEAAGSVILTDKAMYVRFPKGRVLCV